MPYPADYGGVIDVFFKAKALTEMGVKVHLHCFQYGRAASQELDFCHSVNYYKRNMNRTLLLHPMPFIVVSRQSDELLNEFMKDDHPILFEGKHTSYYLDHPDLTERKKYVRTHNVEADYYAGLAKNTSNIFKKWYFKKESKKLKRYQSQLAHADHLFCISPSDLEHFSSINPSSSLITPLHSNWAVSFSENKQPYCLYHGNLAVGENEEAALFLVQKVFKGFDNELKLFGNGASSALKNAVDAQPNVSLIEGGHEKLAPLLENAQINVLATFQSTGMKLKLLHSLFNGGHVLTNEQMVRNTGLESLVTLADTPESFREKIKELMNRSFTAQNYELRKQLLKAGYSNVVQARRMIEVMFPTPDP